MTWSFTLVRVAKSVHAIEEITDDTWTDLGAADALARELSAAFPGCTIESSHCGWIAVIVDSEHDHVLEIETQETPETAMVSGATIRIVPKVPRTGLRADRDHVRNQVRAVADALHASAFDGDGVRVDR